MQFLAFGIVVVIIIGLLVWMGNGDAPSGDLE